MGITYQDFLEVVDTDAARIEFVRRVINDYKASDLYQRALEAYEYFLVMNRTIKTHEKTIVTASGQLTRDLWSPNHRVASGYFKRFVVQQNQYLLGNGVTWGSEATEKKLGKRFDAMATKLGENALIGAVAYGFWNRDHMEVFKATEFAPLFDEENGALRMGVRFWQIDATKPLRATLYEEDGCTEYIWNPRSGRPDGEVLKPKRAYKVSHTRTQAEGEIYTDNSNYEDFPIVPLWANEQHVSELLAIKDGIDAYDLIKNGFENELDTNQIYWIIKGAGGMDSQDLVQFLDRMLVNRIASTEGDQDISAHEISLPYEARERLLDRIDKDLHADYMALNLDEIKSGSVVTAQIKAAYEPMNNKADKYEYQWHEFLDSLLAIVGVEDDATFTRSALINGNETISWLIQAGEYLSREYVTEKVLTVLGDADRVEEVLRQMDKEELETAGLGNDGKPEEEEPEGEEPTEEEE